MTRRAGLWCLFITAALVISGFGPLFGRSILAQPQPLGPNPLRAVLPRASDVPGFEQAADGPVSLTALDIPNPPSGVARVFAGTGDTSVLFELFRVPDDLLASVQPSTAGESLLRPAVDRSSQIANLTVTGPLSIGQDDLSLVWDVYDDRLNAWSALYADVFLSGNVLGIVEYQAPAAAVDPTAVGRYARLLADRVVAPSLPAVPPDWTLQVEQTIVVRNGPRPDSTEHRSTARIWFAPGVGWRVDLTNVGEGSTRVSSDGSDGTTSWSYDPATNHYTLEPATLADGDPRFIFLGGELGLPGTNDVASEIAAFQRLPGKTIVVEGTEAVAGRTTQRVLTSPASCETSETGDATPAGTATTAPVERCFGSVEYWFDVETGWPLQVRGDGIDGQTFTVDTTSAAFDAPLDTSLFQFTPPPGSVRDDRGGSSNSH